MQGERQPLLNQSKEEKRREEGEKRDYTERGGISRTLDV